MTKKDLLRLLNNHTDDILIVISRNLEGDFSPLAACEDGYFLPKKPWSGEFHCAAKTPKIPKEAKKAICFWPVS